MLNIKGFTLIELMVVVVIIGILAAIALPNFFSIQDRAKETEIKSNVHAIQLAVEGYKTLNAGEKPSTASISINPQMKNPFNSLNTGAAVVTTETLASMPSFGTNSTTPVGQVGYTQNVGAGGPYAVTGTGKALKYIVVIPEGQ